MLNSTFNQNMEVSDNSQGNEISLLENQEPPADFITQRIKKQDTPDDYRTLTTIMEDLFSKQDFKLSLILDDQRELKKSMSFLSAKFEEMNKKIDACDSHLSTVEQRVSVLEQKDVQIAQLETKIDMMDQQARSCNIELSNLPERKNESLINIVIMIGTIIKLPITQDDIISVQRVPHMDTKNSRPKNVILKLRSKILRDNFLSSMRLKRGLTSDELNIAGPAHQLFMGEHLTLRNKIIFREARIAAKKHGFTYVWPKNGIILVRADDNSPVFSVRSHEEIIQKIKR